MKYSSYIDNETALNWGLNVQQAVLFDWIYSLPSWADLMTSGSGKRFYYASKNLACKELPLLTDKPDTVYRYYKQLESKGLIEIQKFGSKDFIHLTKKCASWGRRQESEQSEINPSEVGNKSDMKSEINPTNNNTILNQSTIDNESPSLFPEEKKSKKKPATTTLFKNSTVNDFEIFQKKLSNPEFQGVDLNYYYNAVKDWSDSANKKRTTAGWIATARNFMRGDHQKGKLVMVKKEDNREKMSKFLDRK